jgi:hypothetical protein
MRVIFVHGINQQGKSSVRIRDEWLDALGRPSCLAGCALEAPFYGDVLAGLTDGGSGIEAVPQGAPESRDERDFALAALEQIVRSYGIGAEAIEAEQVVAQGPYDDRRLLAIVRVLERMSPLHGSLVLRLIRQAYAYLSRPGVSDAVDAIVTPSLAAGPCIVVGHSLGSVVAFKLLRGITQESPLLLTIGSPLGLVAVQSALGRPRGVPPGVSRWFNGLDPNDAVTLGKPLTKETFAAGIVNKITIDNCAEPHAIAGYLRDQDVRTEIEVAVTGVKSRTAGHLKGE